MPTSHIDYEGNLRTQATHLQSGTTILTDAPTDNHGRGEAFSPTDLTATSLGTCIITTMGIFGQREGLDFAGSSLNVSKVMTSTGSRRIARVEVELEIKTNLELTDELRTKYERIAETCPVALSLHPDVEQVIRINWPVAHLTE